MVYQVGAKLDSYVSGKWAACRKKKKKNSIAQSPPNRQMKKNGAFPLGEFYIFPNTDQDVIADVKASNASTPPSLLKLTQSVLCCSYSIYLASTNLIFQPNTRRMRLRPITAQTIRTRGKKGKHDMPSTLL